MPTFKEKSAKHLMFEQQLAHMQITIDEMFDVLESHATVKFFEFIIHDKDVSDDGSLKAPHIHLYMNFGQSSCKPSQIAKWFKEPTTGPISYIQGAGIKARQYLIHLNDPEKYQYSPKDVVCSPGDSYIAWLEESKNFMEKQDTLTTLVDNYCRGTITYAQAIDRLFACRSSSDDWFKTKRKLKDLREIELKMLIKGERDMQVIMIYGKSQTGKSTYAKILADSLVASGECRDKTPGSSSNDILQDYNGEDVLVLDDLRDVDDFGDYILTLSDMLKFLDPHFASSTKSRYQNKVFSGKYIIITTTKDPRTWYKGSREQRWQFFRRLSQCVHITQDTIETMYIFTPTGETCGFIECPNNGVDFAPIQDKAKNNLLAYIKATAPAQKEAINITGKVMAYTKKLLEEAGVFDPSNSQPRA